MSDYSTMMEKAALYDKAVEDGILPPMRDEPARRTPHPPAAQHEERREPREKRS